LKPPEFAKYWASELGTDVKNLIQLSGGMNNSVFLCRNKNVSWVIKGYPIQKPGQRDRMQAEVDILRYSAQIAPGFTPLLLQVDAVRRCAVMEHIPGIVYKEGYRPCEKDIKLAFDFFLSLNSNLTIASEMVGMDAAEGFLSLKEHMVNVFERLSIMGTEHLPREYQKEADRLRQQLCALAEDSSVRLEDKINTGAVEDAICAEVRCVSPSDFGFHNAIRVGKGIKFIDFEFAGWDDPAKVCIDFALQQRNPVDLRPIEIASRLFPGRENAMKTRIDALAEILELKWLCIILGILNPTRLSHAKSAMPGLTEEIITEMQLWRYHDYCKRTKHLRESRRQA